MKVMKQLLIFLSLMVLGGCTEHPPPLKPHEPTESVSGLKLSWWLVDWKVEASLKDTVQVTETLDQLSLFSGYVGDEGQFYQTEQGENLINETFSSKKIQDKSIFLTLVNDRFTESGVVQKDPTVLNDFLTNPELEETYWNDVFETIDPYPFAGIELDFERIPDESVSSYEQFIERARDRLAEKGLYLRVVLEPRFPFETATLPHDVEYVVMAYNVHGYHTPNEPGPKGSFLFFDNLHERLPRNHDWTIALASGGFKFADGTVTSLTEEEVLAIIPTEAMVKRDPASGVQVATFLEDGIETSIWWADAETFSQWMDYWGELGNYESFSIWRAGGWSADTLQQMNTWKEE